MITLVGCRGDGRATEHSPVAGSSVNATPAAAPADSHDAGELDAPPGDNTLRPVPADLAKGVRLEKIASGLARPTLLVAAPGDARKRLFVLEQHTGNIRVSENGVVAQKPLGTIGPLSKANEEGLLGMAFHPQFATNGRVFVNYTAPDKATKIVEYKLVGDALDASSKRELATIEQPFTNHNGGNLLFGPDGKLYVGMGDGGSAGDPNKNGQNPTALLGKILRIDVDAAKPVLERVHIGVRNPWRFAFDTNGDLYIGDVGQNLWEYVFVVPAGAAQRNFGWNVAEGSHCFEAQSCDKSAFTPPVVEYSHDDGCSITGGFVYRGALLPQLTGRYFYADFCTNFIHSFVWTKDVSSPTAPGWAREHYDWKTALDPDGTRLTQISSFGLDAAGELYVVELTGTIYRLSPAAGSIQ
ncbi:PQQ-dependent sugar dehydrogenase [soil metagenome]